MNKPIEEMIAHYEMEIVKLRERIGALKELQVKTGAAVAGPPELPTRMRVRRGDLKARVLDLLKERGVQGLNATLAAEISARRGDPVDRNSVSSLLSRLKSDGVVEHDGSLYRLSGIKDVADGAHVH